MKHAWRAHSECDRFWIRPPQVIAHSTLGILRALEFLEYALLKPTNLTDTLHNVTRGRSVTQRTRRHSDDNAGDSFQPAPEFSVSVFGELKKEGEQVLLGQGPALNFAPIRDKM
jgi:hypothetical protein